MPIARVLSLVAALVVCAWFAVGIRQARNTDHATSVIGAASSVSPDRARQLDSTLDAAGWLNPDRTVDILRGQLEVLSGDPGRGEATLLRVTRAEPMNLQAWIALSTVAFSHDRREFSVTVKALGRLDPRLK